VNRSFRALVAIVLGENEGGMIAMLGLVLLLNGHVEPLEPFKVPDAQRLFVRHEIKSLARLQAAF
jgi:hypothetical protein